MTAVPRPHPMLRYVYLGNRIGRVIQSIVVLYLLLNGSKYCVLLGLPWLLTWLWQSTEAFWAAIMTAIIGIALIFLVAPLIRRFRLAISQMNIWLNGVVAGGVAGLIIVAVLIADRLWGPWDTYTFWEVFQWTWQIPVGVFIGRGLSWAIVDRRISGVVAVDTRGVEQSLLDASERHDLEHHHDH